MAIVDGHIRCCRCGEMKPLDAFAPSFAKQGNGRCRACCRRIARGGKEWAKTAASEEFAHHRAVQHAYYLKTKTKHGERARAHRLAADYGLTVQDVERMRVAQGGRCACCGTTEPGGRGRSMHVDHDHVTGAVRGLICHNCNRSIGLLGDDAASLRRALSYLERASGPVSPALRINLLRAAG